MNAIELNSAVLTAPYFLIAAGIVMVVLMALTVRSVIMREKAMIRRNREDADLRAAYETRWRNTGAA